MGAIRRPFPSNAAVLVRLADQVLAGVVLAMEAAGATAQFHG